MNILEIIEKKKNKQELTEADVRYFIIEYIKGGAVKDYQASSLLMAMRLNGLSIQESFYLTKIFVETSELFNFTKNNINTIFIDKHSSGGVGDKVSIILLPILIALGIEVPKISGRGLGHTGGTIDKLESVGVKTDLTFEEANKILNNVGCVIMSQTENLVPADKLLYALRDVTGTVDTPGLMISSILSKKFVLNTDHIFIDLKVGNGAILNSIDEVTELAKNFIEIAKLMKRKLTVTITSMDQPLGRYIGNMLEIKESVDFLTNKDVSKDLKELIYSFASEILIETNTCATIEEATQKINEVISNQKAYDCFKKWIQAQSGNVDLLSKWSPKYSYELKSTKSGYVNYISTHEMGNISLLLGGGRMSKTDIIDMEAGIFLNKKSNDYVNSGEVIATLYSNKIITDDIKSILNKNISLSESKSIESDIVLASYTTK
ncbi:MAG: thymidine phosphorylase [Mycoplasma sp.]